MLAAIAPYPNIVQEAAAANYGPAVKRRDVPLTTQAAVERQFLADTIQDYDKNIPLEHDEFMNDLMRQGGLLGLGSDLMAMPILPAKPSERPWGYKPFSGNARQDAARCKQACWPEHGKRGGGFNRCVRACTYDARMSTRTRRQPKLWQGAVMMGLGAETVTRPLPEPIKTSTIYLVMGGAALVLAGSIALWWFAKK